MEFIGYEPPDYFHEHLNFSQSNLQSLSDVTISLRQVFFTACQVFPAGYIMSKN